MDEIRKYIGERYNRWLDHAKYHSKLAGSDEAVEILNEVMVSVLEKSETKLLKLYQSKKGKYRDLDFYVLRMIKLNIYSATSPYQNKYKQGYHLNGTDFSRLKIEDLNEDDFDHSGYVFDRMSEIRSLIESMGFSEKAIEIFEFRFFDFGDFNDWEGTESKRELYTIYSKIRKLINRKVKGEILI